MSTFVGHSDLHALHDRHRSSASFTSSFFHESVSTSPCSSSHKQARAAARAVALFERRHVARAHRSVIVLAALAEADAAHRRLGERSLVVGKREERRRLSPGCSRRRAADSPSADTRRSPCAGSSGSPGSHTALNSPNARISSGPNIFGSSAPRDCPSPCSPDSDPP